LRPFGMAALVASPGALVMEAAAAGGGDQPEA